MEVLRKTWKLVRRNARINKDAKLSFCAAIGCFGIGIFGWIINLIRPGSTSLHAFLIVCGFYFVLGLAIWFKDITTRTTETQNATDAEADGCKSESPPNQKIRPAA